MGWIWGKKLFDTKLHHEVKFGYHAVSIDEKRKQFPVSLWDESTKADGQTIEQVWFSGVHSDVGGWYKESGLSDITLQWMLSRSGMHGLRLAKGWKGKIQPDPEAKMHESRTGMWRLRRPVTRTIPDDAFIHGERVNTAREGNQPSSSS